METICDVKQSEFYAMHRILRSVAFTACDVIKLLNVDKLKPVLSDNLTSEAGLRHVSTEVNSVASNYGVFYLISL